jgi:serine/threonine-protein phosphatase CPPED1
MKRLFAAALVVIVVAGVLLLSRTTPAGGPAAVLDFQVKQETVNPWNHLKFNNASSTFRFAVVSDRTGGVRDGVFEHAVDQLNMLQPEFVLCVGDLITGGTEKLQQIDKEWKQFTGFIDKLQMPFFYLPGNHDISNPLMDKRWKEQFGRSYYHFVYKNTLFLMLNTEDPPVKKSSGKISSPQVAYAKQALAANQDVRWTVVLLHKPVWTYKDVEQTGWLEVEQALQGRKYTVLAGHKHNYELTVRLGMKYIMLGTTGGGSLLRGAPFGEFDHITWVTMKTGGPVLCNLAMEGILPEDVRVAKK